MSKTLDRTTFRTSRTMDFFNVKELVTQTGHGVEEWPQVIVKELTDNSLDACEQAGIAPEITITADATGITVTDNGPGLPESTLAGAMDFSVRCSNREMYIAPDRGAQGNALKTLLAMPYVVDPDRGKLIVITGGVRHTIACRADQVSQTPVIQDVTSNGQVTTGTSVRVEWSERLDDSNDPRWPFDDMDPTLEDEPRESIERLVLGFLLFNPHLSIKLTWFGETAIWLSAIDTAWKKWKPNRPTSAHWYEREHIERLIAAIIHNDREKNIDRTVADFISDFDGMSRSVTRKAVMDDCELSRVKLSALACDGELDHAATESLLAAMKHHSKPVKASRLGIIGRKHIAARFEQLGAVPESIEYRAVKIDSTVPAVIEVAFAWLGNASDDERQLFTGINWSSAIRSPFRSIDYGVGLAEMLSSRWMGDEEPVLFLCHMAHPRPNFLDRGKTQVAVEYKKEFTDAIDRTTKKWTAQRRKEDRKEEARERRAAAVVRANNKPMTLVECAEQVIPEAYAVASNNGKHYAKYRQIFYKARKMIQELIGEEMDQKQGRYFTSTLLPNYLSRHAETNGWLVAADARGNVIEPHTGKSVPVGTIEINDYLAEIESFEVTLPSFERFGTDYPTCGIKNRCSGLVFIEKEGFHPLFNQVHLAERFDLMLLSTKGHSVVAARCLVDKLCAIQSATDAPLYILHDFDKSGMLITEGLTRVSQAAREGDRVRYEFKNEIKWFDLGLRLDDVNAWGLENEPCRPVKKFKDDTIATPEEQEFLKRGRRVELNAFSSGDLIKFIEMKLHEHGVKKVVPDDATLEAAYRRAYQIEIVNRQVEPLFEKAKKMADAVEIPGMAASAVRGGPHALEDAVRRRLANAPAMSWDQAIMETIIKRFREESD